MMEFDMMCKIAIHKRYPEKGPKQNALIQNAKALQEAILSVESSNTNAVFKAFKSLKKSKNNQQ